MLHALLEMEDNDKVPEGGVTSGEDVVSAALALMSDFPAWHMSLGDEKCDILQSAIEDRVEHGGKNDVSANDGAHVGQNMGRPFVHVEFGGYLGFSALCALQSVPVLATRQLLVISVEHNPIFAAYMRTILEFLGVPTSSVRIVVGNHVEFTRRLVTPDPAFRVDSVLLDHWKGSYLETLRTVEPVLKQGALVVADNVLTPGVPQAYLDHVRNKAFYESSYRMSTRLEQLDEVPDAIEVSYIL